jgi:hypothetical protein
LVTYCCAGPFIHSQKHVLPFATDLLRKSMTFHGITVPPQPCGDDLQTQMCCCMPFTLCLMHREAKMEWKKRSLRTQGLALQLQTMPAQPIQYRQIQVQHGQQQPTQHFQPVPQVTGKLVQYVVDEEPFAPGELGQNIEYISALPVAHAINH